MKKKLHGVSSVLINRHKKCFKLHTTHTTITIFKSLKTARLVLCPEVFASQS